MRSSLVKHIWLIQPHDPAYPVLPIDAAGGRTVRFAPAWDLLCLRTFIMDRTGHTCEMIDVRLFNTIPEAFREAERHRPPKSSVIAIIYAGPHHASAVIEIVEQLHAHDPDIPLMLTGPIMTTMPEVVHYVPHLAFGLRGDAETILRHVLDALDIPHRLKAIPGLIIPGEPLKPPHWLPNLKALSLPSWEDLDWVAYRTDPEARSVRVEARLSRGHPGTPSDAACPGSSEPLRVWPMTRMAQLLQTCPGHGIAEVFLSDPPGFWTDDRLDEWCRHLRALRSNQSWAFQTMMRDISEERLHECAIHGARRIEWVIPAVEQQHRAALGVTLSDDELKRMLQRCRAKGIDPVLIYWVEGPWSNDQEANAVVAHAQHMGFPALAVYPFPCYPDAPLVKSGLTVAGKPPTHTEWIAALQTADRMPSVLWYWNGAAGLKRIRRTMVDLHKRMARNPFRILRSWWPSLGHSRLETASGHDSVPGTRLARLRAWIKATTTRA